MEARKTGRKAERVNFRITDDDLGAGGPKAKFKANMEAIHLLKKLEEENRLATPKEQEVLSRYVGWEVSLTPLIKKIQIGQKNTGNYTIH